MYVAASGNSVGNKNDCLCCRRFGSRLEQQEAEVQSAQNGQGSLEPTRGHK